MAFDAPTDLLVLAERALTDPFVTPNEHLLAVMLPGLEAAVDEQRTTWAMTDLLARDGNPSPEVRD